MNWYEIKNIDEIDSPALIVYKDRVQQNIQTLLSMKDAAHVRPHVKTNKIGEVCKMMLDAGIKKFKCATIAEAEMLAITNAPDVLLAYQPTITKAKRLIKLIQHYPSIKFSCLIDDAANTTLIAEAFTNAGVCVDVYIDLNVGMNRTGIKPVQAYKLFNDCSKLNGVNIIGLHAYDGHIRDTNIEQREAHADAAFADVIDLKKQIENVSGKHLTLIAGGSPTFPVHAQRTNVECSPGTFVFWDYGYKSALPDEPFEYAALVITRVVSIIDEQTICVDLGHKSIAAENTIDKRICFLNANNIQPVGQSEEHLILKTDNASQYKIGDVLYGVPYHICPTVALYEKAMIVSNNEVKDEWKVVARNRQINF